MVIKCVLVMLHDFSSTLYVALTAFSAPGSLLGAGERMGCYSAIKKKKPKGWWTCWNRIRKAQKHNGHVLLLTEEDWKVHHKQEDSHQWFLESRKEWGEGKQREAEWQVPRAVSRSKFFCSEVQQESMKNKKREVTVSKFKEMIRIWKR
jgi:hypothetical protein